MNHWNAALDERAAMNLTIPERPSLRLVRPPEPKAESEHDLPPDIDSAILRFMAERAERA